MKAGLAAGIAVSGRLAAEGGQVNILFLAVPDEERSSDGARRAGPELRAIGREHDLEIIGAVNLDAIADDGDGSAGRSVALGTIGKLLRRPSRSACRRMRASRKRVSTRQCWLLRSPATRSGPSS